MNFQSLRLKEMTPLESLQFQSIMYTLQRMTQLQESQTVIQNLLTTLCAIQKAQCISQQLSINLVLLLSGIYSTSVYMPSENYEVAQMKLLHLFLSINCRNISSHVEKLCIHKKQQQNTRLNIFVSIEHNIKWSRYANLKSLTIGEILHYMSFTVHKI